MKDESQKGAAQEPYNMQAGKTTDFKAPEIVRVHFTGDEVHLRMSQRLKKASFVAKAAGHELSGSLGNGFDSGDVTVLATDKGVVREGAENVVDVVMEMSEGYIPLSTSPVAIPDTKKPFVPPV
jgi:hypothetical protein